jgi:hypothetical protein
MKHLKLFEDLLDDERLWHHISHHQYLYYLDNIQSVYSESDKIKSIILDQNPGYKVLVTPGFIKANIKYNNFTNTEMKIYILPDEWYLVSVKKEFRLRKDYLYYKCDTLEGFKDLMKWI